MLLRHWVQMQTEKPTKFLTLPSKKHQEYLQRKHNFGAGGNSLDHRRPETALQINLRVQCVKNNEFCSRFSMGMVVHRISDQEPQKTHANRVQFVQDVKFAGNLRFTQKPLHISAIPCYTLPPTVNPARMRMHEGALVWTP